MKRKREGKRRKVFVHALRIHKSFLPKQEAAASWRGKNFHNSHGTIIAFSSLAPAPTLPGAGVGK